MKTLLKNLTVIPVTRDSLSFKADILISGSAIEEIGPGLVCPEADVVRDCTGLIAMPGFVNAHTHLSMTLMRNYKDTCSNLQDWLGEIFPIEDRMTDEDIYYGSLLGLAELIKSGTTSFADMYFHQWMTARACRETGMRAFISQTLFGDLEETKKRLSETRLDREIDNELLRKDYAVHAVYTCTKETYEYTAAAARERKAVVNTHLSETKKEMDDCLRQTGMLPAVYLEKTGFFDVPCYAAHGVWLQEEETEILRCHDVGIVHNPSSNCKLASGIAPVSRFMSAGLTVGLGTDGASSNNNLSMLKEMRLAAMISAVSTMNVGALRPYDIIRMATLDSAKVLKADHLIGSLEKGKKADITIINPNSANMTPMNDIFSAIVFSADERNIDSVYVNGKCLFCEGKLTTIDEDAVIHEALKRWDILRKEG